MPTDVTRKPKRIGLAVVASAEGIKMRADLWLYYVL